MLANPPWRQLRERAEKISGDQKHDHELGGGSHRAIVMRSSIQHSNALANGELSERCMDDFPLFGKVNRVKFDATGRLRGSSLSSLLPPYCSMEAPSATITPSTILVIEKPEMIRLLHAERALSDRSIKHVLSRKIRIEEDMVDQLFNSAEKRLARTLLLARYGKPDKPEKMVPGISQEMLAEMIGTTRSRVNCFMNKFRKLGFIEYGGRLRGLQINKSFLSVLQD
jgi:hypothetical protein